MFDFLHHVSHSFHTHTHLDLTSLLIGLGGHLLWDVFIVGAVWAARGKYEQWKERRAGGHCHHEAPARSFGYGILFLAALAGYLVGAKVPEAGGIIVLGTLVIFLFMSWFDRRRAAKQAEIV